MAIITLEVQSVNMVQETTFFDKTFNSDDITVKTNNLQESFTATAAQTVFDLTTTAFNLPDSDANIYVTDNGVRTYDWVRTDYNTITFNTGITIGHTVVIGLALGASIVEERGSTTRYTNYTVTETPAEINALLDGTNPTGTQSASFIIDTNGTAPLRLKNDSGDLLLRNNADSAYVDLYAKDVYVTGGLLTFDSSTIEDDGANTLTITETDIALVGNVTASATVLATTFDTNVAAAGVTLAGTTLAADGTDANISITATTKGTGVFDVSEGLMTLGTTTLTTATTTLTVTEAAIALVGATTVTGALTATGVISFTGVAAATTYADNTAAKAGGLVDGNLYWITGTDYLAIVHS